MYLPKTELRKTGQNDVQRSQLNVSQTIKATPPDSIKCYFRTKAVNHAIYEIFK